MILSPLIPKLSALPQPMQTHHSFQLTTTSYEVLNDYPSSCPQWTARILTADIIYGQHRP